ncbi:mitogen-activated protein kinase 15 isoform X3 [Mugil cephalus]|uniref:mitogen-activated protein kinase 15 isoform X3 n=1 Tax=Mugil cephalus TaxID=48193 RepID=UPI001FB5FB6D|nr:mitogen-activated protein kinase 15 isoform X3 [Mugil cephalus]
MNEQKQELTSKIKMSKSYESATISEVEGHISLKYEIKKRLGKGAYGIVWKAVDRQTGEIVAVKKIFDAFRNRTDAQRTFREILFLQEFGDHANIVKLLNVIRAQNDKDIYLIFEYMDTDLHAVIKKGTLLKDIHKRYVMYQLFKAIKYLHSGNVIHRDQKPSNVLLDTDCVVKLCDFGLARSLNQIQEDSGNPALTEYVATRWYRAPEILLGSSRPQVPLEDLLQPSVPPDALDLLRGLLVFNPDKRLTAEQALKHPYVARFHNPAKEPALNYDVVLPVDDDVQLSVVQYRNKLYEMILERRTNQGMLRLIQPKNGGCVSSDEKPGVRCEKEGEKGAAVANGGLAGNHEEKPQPEKTDETSHAPSHVGVAKSGPVTGAASSAAEKMSPGKQTYNPITHAPNVFVRSPAASHYHHSTAANRKAVGQTNGNATSPPTEGTNANVTMDQILQRGRSAPVSHNRSFSSALNQTQSNPLVRKEDPSLSAGLQVTSARLQNQRSCPQSREARPQPRFNKKVFQSNCNVAAAGDPRAKLGSYAQAYGTINKTELDNLLRSRPYNQ